MQETQEMQVLSQGQEDPLEEGMASHSSIHTWRIPWMEEPGGLWSMQWQRVGHDWNTLATYSRAPFESGGLIDFNLKLGFLVCSVQFSSVGQSCPTLCDPMNHSTPGLPVHHQLPEFTHAHRVGDAIQPSHPLSSPSPPTFNLSQHYSLFQSVLHIRWPKYLTFSFYISPSSECSGLISFRMDWLDLLAVQRTLKSLLQHHSSKASFLRHSVFFIVQLSHPYMTTGKTIGLTRWTFVGKVMSMLSRLVITFFPRSRCLLISWLQSPSAVILEAKNISLSLFPHRFAMKW